jgi:hypothetical protein
MLFTSKLVIVAIGAAGVWRGWKTRDRFLTYEAGTVLALITPTFYQF